MISSRYDTLTDYIDRQREWSLRTFGNGPRRAGIIAHIESELREIETAPKPDDLYEWIDVIILALDGAWRAGYEIDQILTAMRLKQKINFAREWPPPGPQHEPTEHVRG
jgi:hypothetical protein